MILSFFIGGSLFTIIELVVNRFDNAALGALISMIPIGFLTTFIIKKSNIVNYVRNIFFVVCLNLICSVIFYIGLKFLPLDKNIVILSILGLWVILQSLNYKYNIFSMEPKKFIKNNI